MVIACWWFTAAFVLRQLININRKVGYKTEPFTSIEYKLFGILCPLTKRGQEDKIQIQ